MGYLQEIENDELVGLLLFEWVWLAWIWGDQDHDHDQRQSLRLVLYGVRSMCDMQTADTRLMARHSAHFRRLRLSSRN